MNLKSYNFSPEIQKTLEKLNFTTPTPIQERAIPHILQGRDVAGLAQTGTGKTMAFLMPLFERVLRSGQNSEEERLNERGFENWEKRHFNLILVPTRELAEQIKTCALDLVLDSSHQVVAVYGGVPIERQVKPMKQGFTFLIATPGRLIDLYKHHEVDLKQVRSITFDEADRMFDMGFKDDMKYVLRRIPENRQLLLFSATLNLDVLNVAYQFGANPVEIKINQDQPTAKNVEDRIFHLGRSEKPAHLLGLLNREKSKQVIVFTNFKSQVEKIAEFLNRNNFKALGISSLLPQNQRKNVMNSFRSSQGGNILVATDVAARGLDIEEVDLVINYELPEDMENYVHRIGRTGRANKKGQAFSFVSDKDVESLDRIHKYLGRSIERDWMEDGDLPKNFLPFPKGDPLLKQMKDERIQKMEDKKKSSFSSVRRRKKTPSLIPWKAQV